MTTKWVSYYGGANLGACSPKRHWVGPDVAQKDPIGSYCVAFEDGPCELKSCEVRLRVFSCQTPGKSRNAASTLRLLRSSLFLIRHPIGKRAKEF